MRTAGAVTLRRTPTGARPLSAEADAGRAAEGDTPHAERQRYVDVLRGINAVVWEWDVAAGRFTFVSDGVQRVLGYAPELFLDDADTWRQIIHQDDHDRVLDLRARMPDELTLEYRAITASGQTRWIRDEVRRVSDGGADLLRGVATDITEAKRAEDALRASRDFYFSLFDDFPTMIWRSREDGFCDYFNRAWLEFSGRRLADELGDGWSERVHPDEVATVLERWRAAVAERSPFRMEYRLRHRSGEYRPVLDMGRPFHSPEGEYLGYVGSVVDLSEQRALEQQLRQAQKIEAIGQLAGGIAHDFNNILTAIQGHAELALQESDPHSVVAHEVEEVRRAAARAAGLTRQLLAYSRRQVLQPTVFEMGDVIEGMHPMLRRLIAENIELACQYPRRDARVHADRGQIEQVLMNLVVNARDAMAEAGGSMTITVDTLHVDGDAHPAHAFIPGGAYVRLRVADTGTGMTASVLNRLFEPFFTTKEPGRGTGLGLATAYGIVKQSGGFILAESEPGAGSVFEVLIPRVREPAADTQAETPSAGTLAGWERVLVVEDEQAVRRLMVRALQAQGYQVSEAAHAEEAESLLEAGAAPHLLITDVVLPGTSGVDLARRLVTRLPQVRILLASGFPRDHFEGGIPKEWGFLEKPFTPRELQLRVRTLLDAPA